MPAVGGRGSLYRWAMTLALFQVLRRSAAFLVRPTTHSCAIARHGGAPLGSRAIHMSMANLNALRSQAHLTSRLGGSTSACAARRTLVRRFARDLGPEVVQEVKAAVSIVEVIGQYVKLEKTSSGWQGCCPFHDDKSPSLGVSEEKGLYNCFGCGASGDTVKFLSEIEGYSFPEAVEKLAEIGGVELPESTWGGGPPRNYTGLYSALDSAAEYYAQQIMEGPGGIARSHLSERRISPGVAADFQLGLSPAQPGALYAHLEGGSVTEEEMIEAGLFHPNAIAKGEGRPLDRFFGRLIIPIHNAKGQVVGFGGRLLRDEPTAKYINTPDTPLFKKKSLLFGLHRARAAIRENKVAVIAEGYFDVIALHGAGVRNSVGSMGTAVTVEHIRLLRNALPEAGTIVLCLDGDEPGQRAMERACREVLLAVDGDDRSGSLTIKVATLPEPFKDPADFCMAKGASAGEAFQSEVVDRAVAWKEWYGLRLIDEFRQTDDTAAFSRSAEALTDFLASLPPTKQADRTFLSSLLADVAFPSNAALAEQLTADLIQQSIEKAKRKAAGLSGGSRDWAARRANMVRPPTVTSKPRSPPPASQGLPPQTRTLPAPVQQQQQMPQQQQQQQQQMQMPPQQRQQMQQPPMRPPQADMSMQPLARQAPFPPRQAPFPPSAQTNAPIIRRMPDPQSQAARPLRSPPPPPAASPPSPPLPPSSPKPINGGVTARSLSVAQAEESVLRLALRDVGARQVLHDLIEGKPLHLSNRAHQALYDWLFCQPRGGPPATAQLDHMASSFASAYPEFTGLRRYFLDPLGPEQDPAMVSELPARLSAMVEASIADKARRDTLAVAERARREKEEWARCIQRLDVKYDEEPTGRGGEGDGQGPLMPQQRMGQVNGYREERYQGRGQEQINGEGEEEGEWEEEEEEEEEEEPRQASYAAEQRPRQPQQAQQWQQQQWQQRPGPQGPSQGPPARPATTLPRYPPYKSTPTPPSTYPRPPPPYQQNQRPQPVRPNGYNNGYNGGKKY